jgi:hypothetical protein
MTDAPPADRHARADSIDDEPGGSQLGPEQGGGPPFLLPWTLVVDDSWEADLEHGAPLPRVGELIEYIGDQGDRRSYRVVRVVHTLQRAASTRPPVSAEQVGPNTTVDGPMDDGPPIALRAGLPRVLVEPAEPVNPAEPSGPVTPAGDSPAEG